MYKTHTAGYSDTHVLYSVHTHTAGYSNMHAVLYSVHTHKAGYSDKHVVLYNVYTHTAGYSYISCIIQLTDQPYWLQSHVTVLLRLNVKSQTAGYRHTCGYIWRPRASLSQSNTYFACQLNRVSCE